MSLHELDGVQSHADGGRDGLTFSDEEDEYNYYTGSDFEEEETPRFLRFRSFLALMVPVLISAASGCLIAKNHQGKNECEGKTDSSPLADHIRVEPCTKCGKEHITGNKDL